MEPTIGRIVHYWPGLKDGIRVAVHASPCVAIVVYVHSPTDVNLTVYGHDGVPHCRRAPFYQERAQDVYGYACWPARVAEGKSA
jgi:hypothetical protein